MISGASPVDIPMIETKQAVIRPKILLSGPMRLIRRLAI
jgi:hypothetical protein